jgi:hypothetical protein
MSELHQAFHRALDDLVEEPDEHGDWGRIVTDADRGTRRAWVLRIAVVGVAAVVAVGAALVSPFEDEQPTGVVGRALAAIGDGPVIHLVTRGDWGGTLVDLSTGELTPVHGETEVWYDPARGVHYLSWLGDTVTHEYVRPPDQLSEVEVASLVGLAGRYRDELKSGQANVVAEGRVGDRRVLWIRVRSQWLPDTTDGRNHLFTEEVAVDRTTYEPVYMRSTRDGRPPPGAGQLILKLEALGAGEGDFTVDEETPTRTGPMRFGPRGDLSRAALAATFDGKALWLGEHHDGNPLVQTQVMEFATKGDDVDEWETVRGVSLYYGSLHPKRGGIRPRDEKKPFVLVTEATELSPAWMDAHQFADIPEGSVLVGAGRTGLLERDGVFVSLSAPKLQDVLEAAAALRRVGDATPPASDLDFERIARLVQRQQLVEVEGVAPVKPRPLFPRNARPLQRGEAKGVKVTTYTGLAARFDTRAMDPELQRQLPERLNGHCFGLHGDVTGTGAGGWIPRNGVRAIVQTPNPRPPGLRPRRPISRRFDACQIGASFGRNWLQRLDWHGLVEIPLTERGRRFFEERAAAIELGHFVRNGTRKRARVAMKRGAAAPPAASLRDPTRPYIRVSAGGDRFTAFLTASTGRRFFIEINRGRIGRTNAKGLAFIR